MQNPDVSAPACLIPALNNEKSLGQCLDHIVRKIDCYDAVTL